MKIASLFVLCLLLHSWCLGLMQFSSQTVSWFLHMLYRCAASQVLPKNVQKWNYQFCTCNLSNINAHLWFYSVFIYWFFVFFVVHSGCTADFCQTIVTSRTNIEISNFSPVLQILANSLVKRGFCFICLVTWLFFQTKLGNRKILI